MPYLNRLCFQHVLSAYSCNKWLTVSPPACMPAVSRLQEADDGHVWQALVPMRSSSQAHRLCREGPALQPPGQLRQQRCYSPHLAQQLLPRKSLSVWCAYMYFLAHVIP
jgi:hypothetical protein